MNSKPKKRSSCSLITAYCSDGNAGAPDELDFEDVKSQEHAKREMEAAAAGSHNVLTL